MLYLIAPATANTIAKLAHGHADNLLTTAALAAACPVAVAPAMNNRMYLHPATQANLACSRARGVTVIAPGEGELASHGEHGVGRLAEPAQLLAACEALLAAPAAGRWRVRVLVTAGGTREPIDSVRFIGNRSSGRMGYALAAQAARRGAEVTRRRRQRGARAAARRRGRRGRDRGRARRRVRARVRPLRRAADGGGRGRLPSRRPRPSTNSRRTPARRTIELEPTERRAQRAGGAPPRRARCSSASPPSTAMSAVAYGRGKLERKALDAIVVNDISLPGIGFDAPENEVTIVSPTVASGMCRVRARNSVADGVLDEVERC